MEQILGDIMKLIKQANGKGRLKISKAEWEDIGRKHGWLKTAQRVVTLKNVLIMDPQTGQQRPLRVEIDDPGETDFSYGGNPAFIGMTFISEQGEGNLKDGTTNTFPVHNGSVPTFDTEDVEEAYLEQHELSGEDMMAWQAHS